MTALPWRRRRTRVELFVWKTGAVCCFWSLGNTSPCSRSKHPRGFDSDLSFNGSGNRLAIGGADGTIEIMSIDVLQPVDRLPVIDASKDWTELDLIKPSSFPRVDRRAIAFGSDGKIHLTYTTSDSDDYDFEGSLNYATCSNTGRLSNQPIVLTGDQNDQRIDYRSMAMAIDSKDRPHYVFRQRHSKEGVWDGAMYHTVLVNGRRQSRTRIHDHGNRGFYPYIRLGRDDQVREIWHFSFDGFSMKRSSPGKDVLGEWDLEDIGRAGDGFAAEYVETPDDTIHSIFRWNPINSANTPKVYFQRSVQR